MERDRREKRLVPAHHEPPTGEKRKQPLNQEPCETAGKGGCVRDGQSLEKLFQLQGDRKGNVTFCVSHVSGPQSLGAALHRAGLQPLFCVAIYFSPPPSPYIKG